jgi:hypothetical protein
VLSRLFLRYAYPVHCRLAQDPLALIVLQNVMLALADPSGRYRVLDRVGDAVWKPTTSDFLLVQWDTC